MALIGGFDPNLGIASVADGYREIGRANLPASLCVIPESMADPAEGRAAALVHGKLSDSALLERFSAWLAPDIRHRELLAPDVFFEALERTAESFENLSDDQGEPREGPLAQAARALRELLADRELCEMLRHLVLRA